MKKNLMMVTSLNHQYHRKCAKSIVAASVHMVPVGKLWSMVNHATSFTHDVVADTLIMVHTQNMAVPSQTASSFILFSAGTLSATESA